MQTETITILGCGWLGLPLAQALTKEGFAVKGSTTKEDNLEEVEAGGLEKSVSGGWTSPEKDQKYSEKFTKKGSHLIEDEELEIDLTGQEDSPEEIAVDATEEIPEENIELVSLAHFRGRTFDHAVCIVDEFQNLTKQQLQMVLSRLGKESIMILTGDRYQIDLKFGNDSAVHEVPKLTKSKYVNEIILLDNHRHEALDEILKLLNETY